jgi:hypothetical protein
LREETSVILRTRCRDVEVAPHRLAPEDVFRWQARLRRAGIRLPDRLDHHTRLILLDVVAAAQGENLLTIGRKVRTLCVLALDFGQRFANSRELARLRVKERRRSIEGHANGELVSTAGTQAGARRGASRRAYEEVVPSFPEVPSRLGIVTDVTDVTLVHDGLVQAVYAEHDSSHDWS